MGKRGPKVGLRRAHQHRRQHEGEGSDGDAHRWGSLARGPDTVAGWCRRVRAVQGARLHRCRRSSAGLVKLFDGGGLLLLVWLSVILLLALLLLLLFLPLLLCWCSDVFELWVELLSSLDLVVAAADRVIPRGSRVSRLRLGDLYGGARVWAWLRPGDLCVCAGMRGGIAAVRRCGVAGASQYGSVADTGGAAVSLSCRGTGTGEAQGRPVTRAGAEAQAKGKARLLRGCCGAKRGGAEEAAGRGERRKGKLTRGPRLSAPQLEGEGALRRARLAGLGRGLWAVLRGGKKETRSCARGPRLVGKREKEARLAWAVAPWGVYVISF
jgi:hypothetical protein